LIVAETDRLIIRESSGRDFSRIYSMMLSESAEGNGPGNESGGSDNRRRTTAVRDRVSVDEDEELEKFLAYIHTVYSVFGFGLWTVCLKGDSTADIFADAKDREAAVIGRCGLQPIADDNSPLGRIELGYLIDPAYRRKGYAYEACSAILDYAFRRLEIDEVSVEIEPSNTASVRLARKLGFRYTEGNLWTSGNPVYR